MSERPIYRYHCKYRRFTIPSRVIRVTVTAHDADDARRIAALRDPDFSSTVESPRRGKRVILEEPDGMDQAKAREFVEWRGCQVEVV